MATKKPRAHSGYSKTDRAFIVSMVRAGIASSSGWLNEGQIQHGMILADRLEALPLARQREKAVDSGQGDLGT